MYYHNTESNTFHAKTNSLFLYHVELLMIFHPVATREQWSCSE